MTIKLLPLFTLLLAPVLPPGVAPLPEALENRVEALLEEAEKYRGLEAKEAVPSGTVDDTALRKKVVESFQTDLPPEKLRPVETALKAFGLVPESLDLAKFFPDLLTSQVAGFYDPERHYLALVQRDGEILPATDFPADFTKKVEEAVLVHELTHALQDQHFHLETLASGQPLDDADVAKVALVEGDATLVMMDFFAEMSLAKLPGVEEAMGSFLGDPRKLLDSTPGVPGAAELASAPAWFQDTLLFSYFEGFQFALSARRKGGQALLDHAFSTDPPRSSEQILHPEKWHTKRDDPVVIPWPDLARVLPGWSKVAEAQLGELTVRTLLRTSLKKALKKDNRAAQAAAGWAGDRFAVYEKNGERLLAWITEWDTDADAREFQGAARELGRSWAVQRSGRRVVVVRGALKKPERAALQTELAAARAERPANRNIDLAAIGIKPTTEESTIEELLENPQVQKAMAEMQAQDLGTGELSQDGHTYSNPELGFSIDIPSSQRGWMLSTEGGQPGVAVMFYAPDRSANVAVIHLPFGQPVDVENMGPMIEMGMKIPMAEYKKIGGGIIERDGVKAYEVEFEAMVEGRPVRGLQRFYGQGTNLLMVGGYVTPPDQWKKREKPVRESLDSFVVREPASAPK